MPFKKLKSLGRAIAAGVLFWGAILGPASTLPAWADRIGTAVDRFSVGKSASDVGDSLRVDANGNVVISSNVTVGGSFTQNGNIFQTGNETVSGNSTNGTAASGSYAVPATTPPSFLAAKGTFVMGPRVALGLSGPTGLASTNTIPVNGSFETVISSGSNLLMAATPTVSTNTLVGGTVGIADGTILVIASSATQVITLQSNGLLSGSLLKLGATTRAITQFKRITLQFDATEGMWEEIAYSSDAN